MPAATVLTAPVELPDLVVVSAGFQAFPVGNPQLEGDSVLIGEVWPDNRLGWRIGDPFRMPISGIHALSLDDPSLTDAIGYIAVWAMLSRATADRPVPWYGVYTFGMTEHIPTTCIRVAVLSLPPQGDLLGLEHVRSVAGGLGANALHLSSWEESGTGTAVQSALFGSEWDFPAALALMCPDLPMGPSRTPKVSGGGP